LPNSRILTDTPWLAKLENMLWGWSSFILPNSRILTDTPWLAKLAVKMILA
jgi:hypothetical protein